MFIHNINDVMLPSKHSSLDIKYDSQLINLLVISILCTVYDFTLILEYISAINNNIFITWASIPFVNYCWCFRSRMYKLYRIPGPGRMWFLQYRTAAIYGYRSSGEGQFSICEMDKEQEPLKGKHLTLNLVNV